MAKFDYDIIVIGGGAAGFVASKFAAGLGKRTALIEKKKLGGECTLSGCIPSKALLKSAAVARQTRNLGKFGLQATDLSISSEGVMDHVRSIVRKVYSGHTPETFRELGIDVLFGEPRFSDNHSIKMDGKRISAAVFIISAGSSASIPAIEGIDTVPFLTNENFFELERLPASMIVLGGGPIGIELASAMNRLGTAVTVVELAESILAREDREMATLLSKILEGEGLNLQIRKKAVRLARKNGRVVLTVEDERRQSEDIAADSILVAVGRKANVEGLDLEKAGVEYTLKSIKTDERLRTTAANIYACGDIAGPYQFSHMAEYQARIAVQNAVFPPKKRVDYSNVAWCTFTDPELARAGLTEEEARRRYSDRIGIYRCEFGNIDRAKTDVSEAGRSKFIVDSKGKLVGVHILGSRAGDIIHEVCLAKALGVPFHKLDSLVHIYPTFSDVIKQPAKQARIDRLRRNPFLKLLGSVFSRVRK